MVRMKIKNQNLVTYSNGKLVPATVHRSHLHFLGSVRMSTKEKVTYASLLLSVLLVSILGFTVIQGNSTNWEKLGFTGNVIHKINQAITGETPKTASPDNKASNSKSTSTPSASNGNPTTKTPTSSGSTPSSGGATNPTPSPAPSAKPAFYGINLHPVWMTTAEQDKAYEYVVDAGIQTVRMDVPWDVIEQVQGTYRADYLGRIDYAVDQLTKKGVKPLLIILNTPKWETGNADPHIAPNNNQNFVNYMTFIMQRYKGKVAAYEIWNEPDGYWAWTNPDAAKYTALLKACYTAAKNVDPAATILGGSLSNYGTRSQDFLKNMYQQGARNYFDVLSQHLYGDPPGHGNMTPEVLFDSFTTNILPIMQQNGDGNKRVWLTEQGYNTTPEGGLSETQQADYLTRSYKKVASMPQLDNLYTYQLYDFTRFSTYFENYYGLIDGSSSTWAPKPAYYSLRKLATGR